MNGYYIKERSRPRGIDGCTNRHLVDNESSEKAFDYVQMAKDLKAAMNSPDCTEKSKAFLQKRLERLCKEFSAFQTRQILSGISRPIYNLNDIS